MLDDLNNAIVKITELFLNNADSNSFCNSNNSSNHNINRSIEMSAGENFIDTEECRSSQQNIFVAQKMHRQSTDHSLYSKSKLDTNLSIMKGDTQQNLLQQETDEWFYPMQSSDIKTDNLNSTVHFFPWQNPYACQCGMIYNKS